MMAPNQRARGKPPASEYRQFGETVPTGLFTEVKTLTAQRLKTTTKLERR
jgi:hypothetical protein